MTTQATTCEYSHTQTAPLWLVVAGSGVACFVLAWLVGETAGYYIAGSVGALLLLVSTAIKTLTVEDRGDVLAIRFGPVPLFRRTVRYADVTGAEIGRTMIVDGWGIHYSLRGGVVWNLWGRTCVVVRLENGGPLRIGTDDADNLAAFLTGKIEQGQG